MNFHKVILLEFNELTPALMERFISDGRLPNFKKFRSESEVFRTIATESPPYLEPWIQWVTVHTGLDYDEHQLFHLNEGHKLSAARIWDVVSQHGKDSLVFGSMNVNNQSGFKGWILPDPWCTEVAASDDLKDFFKFIQANVSEYSNDKVPLTRTDYLKTIGFLLRRGISASTVFRIAAQLIEDRGGRFRWKRATLLDQLMLDVFRWYWDKKRPVFASFFANSTAHFQHSYWRNMEPDRFDVKPTNPKPDEYENAIAFGYEQMDELLGRFVRLAGESATIIFSTAISQQPCLKYETQGGAFFHRLRDPQAFLKFTEIKDCTGIAPVMTHQMHLDFPTEKSAETAARILQGFCYENQPLLQVQREGTRLFAGCRIYRCVDLDEEIVNHELQLKAPMRRFFYRMDTNKSGMHHPEGMFWIHRPRGCFRESVDPIPLAKTYGMVLESMNINA